MGDHSAEHSGSKSSSSAERMIEARIDELRAIALGSLDDAAGEPMQVDDSTPFEDDPTVAVLQPTRPLEAPSLASNHATSPPERSRTQSAPIVVPQATGISRERDDHSLVQMITASVSRVEYAVQEDFARLEELLRGWGVPSDQMLAGMQRMERSLRAEMARILELVHSVSVSPGVIANAIEASANQLEERNQQRFAEMNTELERMVSAIREYGESVAKAAGSAGAIAGSGVADRVTKSLDTWAGDVSERITQLRTRIDEVDTVIHEQQDISSAETRQVSNAVASGMTTVADAVTQGLDSMGDAVMAVERRLSGHMSKLIADEMTGIVSDELNRLVSVEMKQLFNTSLDRRATSTHKRFDELGHRVDELRQTLMHQGFDEVAKRIDTMRTTFMQQGFAELGRRIDTLHTNVIERGFADIAKKLDHVQESSIDTGFDEIAQKIDTVRTGSIEHGFDDMSARIDELQNSLMQQGFGEFGRELDSIRVLLRKAIEQDIGTGEIVADSLSTVARHVNRSENELGMMRTRVEELIGRVEQVSDNMESVDSAVQEIDTHIGGRVDVLDARIARQIAHVSSSLSQQLSDLDERLTEQIHQLEQRPVRTTGVHVDDETITKLHAAVTVAGAEGFDTLLARIEELEETLLIVQDDVPEEVLGKVGSSVAPLAERIDSLERHINDVHELISSSSATAHTTAPIEEPALNELRADLVEQIDQGRIQHAQDVDMLLDGMLSVWQRLAERMDAADERMSSLTQALQSVAASNADILTALAQREKRAPKKRTTTTPSKSAKSSTRSTKSTRPDETA